MKDGVFSEDYGLTEARETLIHADFSLPELQTLNFTFQQEIEFLNCIQMGKTV